MPLSNHDVEHSFQLDTGVSSRDPLKDSSSEKNLRGKEFIPAFPIANVLSGKIGRSQKSGTTLKHSIEFIT